MNILDLVGRTQPLFEDDLKAYSEALSKSVTNAKFLVIGGAGTIGQAVVKEIFKRQPKKLHVVDISENNLTELVRDLRSSFGYIFGDFRTFALDIGSVEYDAMFQNDGDFDYVLNLSALKHVRSEKDPYTLMRLVDVNILNTQKTIRQSIAKGVGKYFCVSTDKAANPVNMMGASKRIMEKFLAKYQQEICISTARFANVAFSDGSLLHGFEQRIKKQQPIAAPSDVKRYFVTEEESGILCLMSCLFGQNGEIFFPQLDETHNLITFSAIAKRYLKSRQLKAYECRSEDEARDFLSNVDDTRQWPCLFTTSDTSGEKAFEEFFTIHEDVDLERFDGIGVIRSIVDMQLDDLAHFESEILRMKTQMCWNKEEMVALFKIVLPEFEHHESGKYLDGKM